MYVSHRKDRKRSKNVLRGLVEHEDRPIPGLPIDDLEVGGVAEDGPDAGNLGHGVGWDVCEDLRDYAKVSKSELTIDSRLLVPNPSRFDYNLPDERAYKLSPKAYLNTPLIHFSSVWEAVACH